MPFLCAMQKSQVGTIEIQPYEGIPNSYIQETYVSLLKVYPKVIINKPIELPLCGCVNGRYRADTLMKYLRKMVSPSNIIIGLTDKDITCPKGKIKDWGIFGYGDCPGNVCVASSYRLNKNNKSTQLYKTAVHEIGHNFGLDHCPNTGCLMSDAKGKNTMDKENSFCASCTKYLLKKNWKL